MSISELPKKTETWTDEIERLVAKKVIQCNPMEVLSLVRCLLCGDTTHDEFEQKLLDLKLREFKYLTEIEREQAAIRQAHADMKRLQQKALDIIGEKVEPSLA